MTNIKAPFFEIGPKSYLYGDQILDLALAADAAGQEAVVSAQDLAPNYLRLSQAERERLERLKNEQ